jgi:hypothetical protein
MAKFIKLALWNANGLAQNKDEIKTFLCKICGFHGGDYEELCLLGCCAVWLL